MKNIRSSKGFTLVEIMIVVVIIGLLAAMAIPAFQKVRLESQKKSIQNNIRQLTAAADQYFTDKGTTTVDVFAELVGTDKYIKTLSNTGNTAGNQAGESYPTVLTQGSSYSVTWPAHTLGLSFTQ